MRDYTPLRFVALNVTLSVILSAMGSRATNEVEVLQGFSKPPLQIYGDESLNDSFSTAVLKNGV